MTKFDGLFTVADWTRSLQRLLERATAAAASGSGADEVQSDLFAFIKESPGKCDFLDKIAAAAANDLFEGEASRLIASMASRRHDLQVATMALKAVTEDMEKTESDLKFDKIVETLEVSAGVINELKDIRGDLDDDEKNLLDQAIAIARTAEDIRKLVKQYQVTDATLVALRATGAEPATLQKLRTIVGRKVRGEGRFLTFVKQQLGSDEVFAKVSDAILAHAAV